ncbi:MAG: hypothetical protein KA224_08615 [Steroidobacteraceae bacterium]|nr:hypothetical protein [Steroidobacteraceae bacterium]MBP8176185.1 hypothetical protein [Xanthomonadales bacterium]
MIERLDIGAATIYHGDCLEVMRDLDVAAQRLRETVAGAAFLNPAQVELDGIAPEEQPAPAA